MAETNYPIPENPIYDPNIRQLQNSDPASAETVFNPLIQKLINNMHALQGANGLAAKVPFVHNENNLRVLSKFFGKTIYGTGVLKIDMPTAMIGSVLGIKIFGVDINGSTVWELLLSGYNPTSGWAYTSAVLTSKTRIIDKVKFGLSGGKSCFLLGASRTWNVRIFIETVLDDSLSVTKDNWDISLITSESGITNITETPVNWVVTDDGVWYDLPLVNGAAIGLDRTPQYRKVGNRVELRGYINTNGANWDVALAILPVGFRPAIHQNTPVSVPRAQTSSSVFRTMTVDNNNGGIYFGTPIDVMILDISFSFLVA